MAIYLSFDCLRKEASSLLILLILAIWLIADCSLDLKGLVINEDIVGLNLLMSWTSYWLWYSLWLSLDPQRWVEKVEITLKINMLRGEADRRWLANTVSTFMYYSLSLRTRRYDHTCIMLRAGKISIYFNLVPRLSQITYFDCTSTYDYNNALTLGQVGQPGPL